MKKILVLMVVPLIPIHDNDQEQQDQNLRKHAQSTTGLRTASDKCDQESQKITLKRST